MAPRTRAQRKRARKEEAEEERCQLCLEGEDDGPLVQPCACRDSAKCIHEHCLERWLRTSPREDARSLPLRPVQGLSGLEGRATSQPPHPAAPALRSQDGAPVHHLVSAGRSAPESQREPYIVGLLWRKHRPMSRMIDR